MFLHGIKHLTKFEADEGGEGGNNVTENNGTENEGQQQGEEKKFTQAQVDDLITERTSRAVAKALKEHEEKLADEQNEAKRMAKLSDAEKAKEREKKLEQEIAELKAKQTKTEMTSQARSKLSELSVTANDDVINLLVTDNAESTLENVKKFAEVIESNIEARYQKDRVGNTPGKSTTPESKNEELSLGARLAKQQGSGELANDPFKALERG